MCLVGRQEKDAIINNIRGVQSCALAASIDRSIDKNDPN